jgi:hypothetical protein
MVWDWVMPLWCGGSYLLGLAEIRWQAAENPHHPTLWWGFAYLLAPFWVVPAVLGRILVAGVRES